MPKGAKKIEFYRILENREHPEAELFNGGRFPWDRQARRPKEERSIAMEERSMERRNTLSLSR